MRFLRKFTTMAVNRLTTTERHQLLQPLLQNNHWALVDQRDAIKKTFVFSDFPNAFSFMTQVAIQAEKSNHHPESFLFFSCYL